MLGVIEGSDIREMVCRFLPHDSKAWGIPSKRYGGAALAFICERDVADNGENYMVKLDLPFPTGFLHVGGARHRSLFMLFRAAGRSGGGCGKFVLRMKIRSGAVHRGIRRGILQDMLWLGLNWDEGPLWAVA